MSRWPILAAVAAVVLVAALLGWRLTRKAPTDDNGPPPSALVTVAPVRDGAISRTVEAYGVIAGSAAASRVLSATRDVIVQDVLVTAGQPVAAGAPLAQVSDTPASGLAYRQASDAAAFAQRDLARVQRLYDQHLAANDQLIAAQKAVADAQGALAAQVGAGGGHARQAIVSPIAGVVGQVSVTRGQQVAAGGALVTVVAIGGLVAQLGVEPNRAADVRTGQAVRLASALDPQVAIDSRLTVVGRAVDPTSHLIAVSAPAQSAGLPLGASVRGEIAVATSRGLTVPRASVVYDEDGAHVFVVKAGKARQVAVATGPESGDQIAVTGELHAGDPVVVAGAYQLQDGLAVRLGGQMSFADRLAAHRRSLLALLAAAIVAGVVFGAGLPVRPVPQYRLPPHRGDDRGRRPADRPDGRGDHPTAGAGGARRAGRHRSALHHQPGRGGAAGQLRLGRRHGPGAAAYAERALAGVGDPAAGGHLHRAPDGPDGRSRWPPTA